MNGRVFQHGSLGLRTGRFEFMPQTCVKSLPYKKEIHSGELAHNSAHCLSVTSWLLTFCRCIVEILRNVKPNPMGGAGSEGM